MKKIWIKVIIVAFGLALVGSVNAQDAGSIIGTIKDNQNAILPGAKVTVINQEKGVNQTVTTNDDGVFNFPQIPPGNYSITVVLTGFKKLEKTNVILISNGKLNAGDFIMEVGDVSATVEVKADAGQLQLQSESGERSNVITGNQIQNLGLNGRNVSDLAKLLPGVISGGAASGNGSSTVNNVFGSFNINGTRSDQHEVTVDGVTNFNLGNNTGALVSVNPDAVGEVKILTSNYQAEYGRSGGGFISVTTRGGTNEFHGSGRYFRRHDSLNANNYFNNARGTPRPLYRYNFYGFDFGGPVYLPRFGEGGKPYWSGKKRLFFFINQEYYNQLVPQLAAVNIRVPTAAERNGDFSQSVDGSGARIYVRDPLLSGTCSAASQAACFPNNVIPANRLYTSGLAALRLFPLPNSTGSNFNYSSQVPSGYPRRETILRLDGQVNSSTRVSFRWVNNQDDQQFAYGTTTASWNFPLTITDRKNGPGNALSFSITKNFGATLINEFIFGAGRGGVTIAPSDDKATRSVTGINTPLLYPNANTPGFIPSLNFGAVANSAATATTAVFGPFVQKFVINNFIDNLTKVKGNHTFKFGVYYQRASNESNSQNHVQSDIDFSTNANNPLNTGYGFANAALGVYNSYTQANAKIQQSYFYTDLSFYAQDNWKVNSRLTLDLGIRFSYYAPYVNILGPESFFNPSLFDPSRAMRLYRPVCVGASTCNSGAATYRAIDPTTVGTPTLANTLPGYLVGKLIPNSGSFTNGLGLSSEGYPKGGINRHYILPQPRLGFAWDVTGKHTTIIRGGFGVAFDRYRSDVTGNAAQNQPFVLNPTLNFGYLQDIQSGVSGALSPSAIGGTDKVGDWPAVYSYSLGIQRQLFGMIIDASFVGSQSRHLPRRSNLNSIPFGTAFSSLAQDRTKYAGGVVPTTEPNLPTAYSAANLNFSGANSLSIDFLRPFQGYG
ncbi:MAG: carboxypeptidase regulatory-like domain-containing protein, partial [Actinomycetota bacterium]